MVTNLIWDNGLDVRRTMASIYFEEGSQAALGAESWVLSLLRDDLQDSETDHLGEIWAQEMPVLPIESDTIQGVLQGGLEDLQGRFNVNNLIDGEGKANEEMIEQFQRLLLALELDPRFAGIAADWMDADQEPLFPDGAEDSIYSTRMIPTYRTPNLPLTSASELFAIEGMDQGDDGRACAAHHGPAAPRQRRTDRDQYQYRHPARAACLSTTTYHSVDAERLARGTSRRRHR